mmetsp:Transcript_3678/g.9329  ORF Transcript_3678/g.9329 Transcript_3678/m.9329 type:complete len:171 (-) Transcript_3678:415-927(-)|eukprot:CAMPEP_0181121120 /NCGR_PEP_ID=MMETSP1071-20121207/24556_1 /TAXON_ID=35127 /ORGANISM="Thalassiosira sp., Strain NH16" /LENGTH=170 /DNA_ID=CAMNT_0023205893 /DNA_START=198 /DNA_END=710 /DNA_ORIENTATION=+
MKTFFLFLILAAILAIHPTLSEDVPAPTPTALEVGDDFVGTTFTQRTLSPTENLAPLLDRNPQPSRSPTLRPSDEPTEEGYMGDVDIRIPGIVDAPPGSAANTAASVVAEVETDTPTYGPTDAPDSPRASTVAAASAALPASAGSANLRTGSGGVLLGLAVGCMSLWLGC